MKEIIPQKIKNFYHLGVAIIANFFHGFPGKKIKVIGVTGTNGKTTTVQMIAKILEEVGYQTAVASTINFKIREKEKINKTKFTTLSSWAVQKFLREALEKGCQYVVLEVSSHALDQNRIWGINFETVVITNVTREHLDYHENMENYRIAKLKLLKLAQKVVVNLDMKTPKDFLDCGRKIKFGFTAQKDLQMEITDCEEGCNCKKTEIIKANDLILDSDSSQFSIRGERFFLNLPGLFNVENALASCGVAIAEGIDLKTVKRALEKIKNIPGRMERIPNSQGLEIIVDYAVTPDSLEKIYKIIEKKKKEKSKIISILGACGERDRGKRPIMGRIVSGYADYLILSNEDPYGEDPAQIIEEISQGVIGKEKEKNFWIIPDRRMAIKKALSLSKPGDIFIITGKGAEESMAVGKKRIPWNDKRAILEELEKIERGYGKKFQHFGQDKS